MRRVLTYVCTLFIALSLFPTPAAACIGCDMNRTIHQLDRASIQVPPPPRSADGGDLHGYIMMKRVIAKPILPKPVIPVVAKKISPPVTSVTPKVTGKCFAEPGTPPHSILMRESKGNPTVYNFQGSGASGCWQFMPGTWGNYKGYANAADAPVSVQNERAKQVWAGGAGCGHWSAC